MLTFQEKLAIFESFPELERRDVSLGRVNFHYENSRYDKKTVGWHIHPNGNGFVYAGRLPGVATDDKGFLNIRDFAENELRAVIRRSIDSLSGGPAASDSDDEEAVHEETWTSAKGEKLTVKYEDELWYVFAGLNLESAFETYDEVEEYMAEEGFTKSDE
jgi:hypothetical protein